MGVAVGQLNVFPPRPVRRFGHRTWVAQRSIDSAWRSTAYPARYQCVVCRASPCGRVGNSHFTGVYQTPTEGALDHFQPGRLEMLAGNLFECPIPSAIEDADPDGDHYVCGDSTLFTAAYTTGVCFVAFAIGFTMHKLEHGSLSHTPLPRHREVSLVGFCEVGGTAVTVSSVTQPAALLRVPVTLCL